MVQARSLLILLAGLVAALFLGAAVIYAPREMARYDCVDCKKAELAKILDD